jgi:hypothetical protein
MKSTKISTESNLNPDYLSRRIELFRYNIASCEMRFIERTERVVNLVHIPPAGWSIQGCIPGCGAECEADLAMILLEYLMSCESTLEMQASKPELSLSEQLTRSLSDHLTDLSPGLSHDELAGIAIKCLVHSLDEHAQVRQDPDRITVWFAACPLCVIASESGMHRNIDQAHDLLVDMCRAAVTRLLPEVAVAASGKHGDEKHELELAISLQMN